MMSFLATKSCEEYRKIVFKTPQFYEYFTKASPVG